MTTAVDLGMWGHAQWAFILKLNLFEKTRPLCKERSKGKTLKSQLRQKQATDKTYID